MSGPAGQRRRPSSLPWPRPWTRQRHRRRLDDLDSLVEYLYRIGDYIRGGDLEELALGHLLLKTVLVLDTHVDGLEHQVGGINVFLRELILDTQTTLSLDFALDATSGAFILNRLLGHIRVGDTHGYRRQRPTIFIASLFS